MRRPFIAGNWKMHLTREESVSLTQGISAGLSDDAPADAAVCPPAVYLEAVIGAAKGGPVHVGAQNMYSEPQGAFTGELSAAMLTDIGCQYVILGHSERRQVFGETDEMINKKVAAALAGSLLPILCVGETLEVREAGNTAEVVRGQMEGSLAGFSAAEMENIVVAYEPVWAIGTGKTASPEQAEAVHADLRKWLETRYNTATAEKVRIQYGGSVKPGNAAELLSQPNIDGALVGGASLKVDSFLAIIEAAKA